MQEQLPGVGRIENPFQSNQATPYPNIKYINWPGSSVGRAGD